MGVTKKTLTIEKIIEMEESGIEHDCPLDITLIPNTMGINLCNVKDISWSELDDGQLIDLTINFLPDLDKYNKVK